METNQFERRKKVIYDMICDKQYVPMKIKEMAILLQLPRENRPELKEVLDALILEGKIELTARGKYRKAVPKTFQGTYIAHPKGFGFVEVEGREEDIFIPEDQNGGAMHHDIVQVSITGASEGRRQEGTVLHIVERGIHELVGTYQKARSYGFVVPDNQRFTSDIFIPQGENKGAVNGHKVLVELTSYGDSRRNPEGRVKEIIGHIGDPGTDILSIVYERGIPFEFPEKVMQQAGRTPDEVREADFAGRRDLRDVQMVTMDGEDAKDLDDAVSLSFDGTCYYLGVHIADVANYVQENSAMDREARERGTSVYLADRVIPMLPHRLSNGICSLNAGTDRLALSCLMTIDSTGRILDNEVTESVIHVDRRMSYNEVDQILEYVHDLQAEKSSAEALYDECRPLVPMFEQMEQLMTILRAKRRRRGSIDFDFPESKVILDGEGKPVGILPHQSTTATRIIEEFMLAANETIAQRFFWLDIPFLYRTHETPDEEKLQRLAGFIASFGYGMKGISDEIHPKEIQKLLARIADTPEEKLISRLALRSMKQAKYTTECTGHFGLAAKHYCHFTSPIRRYPDLQIHRIIKDVLRGRMHQEKIDHYTEILPEVAQHCSRTERRADEAERETVKLKKAEYMLQHIGETFTGSVSGMTNFGVYVELENTVEGLVHVTHMYDDRYYYREDTYEMVGADTGRVIRLGDALQVRVIGADAAARTVDFELAEENLQ